MKIIFLENREKTFFWEAIAKKLEIDNRKIFWIIQNHAYKPKYGKKNFIKYPFKDDLIELDKDDIKLNDILTSDRMFNYFNSNGNHYKYYQKQILKILKNIKPDIVFGESTLFHELITIDICKKMNIPYYNPQSSSYPPNSFTFYKYDSKLRIEIPNETYPDKDYENIVRKMEEKKLKIDYMVRNKKNRLLSTILRRIKQIFEYLIGEKYNTPGLYRKLLMNYKRRKNIEKWNKLAIKLQDIKQNKKILFYPMQQQPEANIDVWGKKYQDQAKLIYELKKNLPQNWELVIKNNPKKRYEISDKLIKIMQNNGIMALDSNTKMNDIIKKVDLIVSNTGTISYEAIFWEKPIINLTKSISDNQPGTFKLDKYENLHKILKIVENEEFLTANFNDKVQFMKKISSNTFEGIINDPVHNPNCLDKKNIEKVFYAFCNILKNIDNV